MSSVPNPNFGGEASPAAQEAALDRLKFMMSLLPDTSYVINPPDNVGPVVIDLAAKRRYLARQALGNRYDMIRAAADGFKEIGEPVSPQLRQAYVDLVHDVIEYQASLAPENQV